MEVVLASGWQKTYVHLKNTKGFSFTPDFFVFNLSYGRTEISLWKLLVWKKPLR